MTYDRAFILILLMKVSAVVSAKASLDAKPAFHGLIS
jgi:hypothetical protein